MVDESTRSEPIARNRGTDVIEATATLVAQEDMAEGPTGAVDALVTMGGMRRLQRIERALLFGRDVGSGNDEQT